jgi:peptide/nickel transport system substrate-binding protein
MVSTTFLVFSVDTVKAKSPGVELAASQIVRIGAQRSDIGTMDPNGPVAAIDKGPIKHIFGSLVRPPIGDDLAGYEPYLAESWSTSADSLVWTFKLQKGVQWHKGFGEVTADDVVFSLNRTKSGSSSIWKSEYSNFIDIKALDKYTVQITTKKPDAYFLSKVSLSDGGYIVCKKAVEAAGARDRILKPVAEEIIGFGPFQFSYYKSKAEVALVRNDNYFKGKPIIEKIIYKLIPDGQARELAFLNGELDAILGLNDEKWLDYMVKSGAILEPQGPRALHFIIFDTRKKPFDDIRVRQALYYAVGQEAVIKMQGPSISTQCDSPVIAGVEGHIDAGWGSKYKYDPVKAKALLTEAGYPNGFSVEGFYHTGAWFYDKLVIYQDLWRKIGVDFKINIVDAPVYQQKIKEGTNPIVINGKKYVLPTQWLRRNYHSDSIIGKPTAMDNYAYYSNPELDRLIEFAESSLNKSARLDALAKAQRIVVDALISFPCAELSAPKLRNKWFEPGYAPKSSELDEYEIGLDTKILKH